MTAFATVALVALDVLSSRAVDLREDVRQAEKALALQDYDATEGARAAFASARQSLGWAVEELGKAEKALAPAAHTSPTNSEWKITNSEWKILSLTESAWYDETKGELHLTPDSEQDEDLAKVVLALHATAREYIDNTAAEQVDEFGAPFTEGVPTGEIARRIALALRLVMYGGN